MDTNDNDNGKSDTLKIENNERNGDNSRSMESNKNIVLTYDDEMKTDSEINSNNINNDEIINEIYQKESTKQKCLTKIMAFIAGIFHGIAGPGGVLGVMIALKLNDWFLSSLYLGLFFLSSIVTMGIYATLYGYFTTKLTLCSKNKHKCGFILQIISSLFSFIVGILWLSLTFTNTLDKIFD